MVCDEIENSVWGVKVKSAKVWKTRAAGERLEALMSLEQQQVKHVSDSLGLSCRGHFLMYSRIGGQ